MAILQLLLKEFCDVFLDDLPSKLPLEITITHGSKPVSQLAYRLSTSEASEVEAIG